MRVDSIALASLANLQRKAARRTENPDHLGLYVDPYGYNRDQLDKRNYLGLT